MTQIYLRCDVRIFLFKSIQEIRVDVIAIFLAFFCLQAYSRMIKGQNILVAVFWQISWVTGRRETSNIRKRQVSDTSKWGVFSWESFIRLVTLDFKIKFHRSQSKFKIQCILTLPPVSHLTCSLSLSVAANIYFLPALPFGKVHNRTKKIGRERPRLHVTTNKPCSEDNRWV